MRHNQSRTTTATFKDSATVPHCNHIRHSIIRSLQSLQSLYSFKTMPSSPNLNEFSILFEINLEYALNNSKFVSFKAINLSLHLNLSTSFWNKKALNNDMFSIFKHSPNE